MQPGTEGGDKKTDRGPTEREVKGSIHGVEQRIDLVLAKEQTFASAGP
jgi:hypothetical protein